MLRFSKSSSLKDPIFCMQLVLLVAYPKRFRVALCLVFIYFNLTALEPCKGSISHHIFIALMYVNNHNNLCNQANVLQMHYTFVTHWF